MPIALGTGAPTPAERFDVIIGFGLGPDLGRALSASAAQVWSVEPRTASVVPGFWEILGRAPVTEMTLRDARPEAAEQPILAVAALPTRSYSCVKTVDAALLGAAGLAGAACRRVRAGVGDAQPPVGPTATGAARLPAAQHS